MKLTSCDLFSREGVRCALMLKISKHKTHYYLSVQMEVYPPYPYYKNKNPFPSICYVSKRTLPSRSCQKFSFSHVSLTLTFSRVSDLFTKFFLKHHSAFTQAFAAPACIGFLVSGMTPLILSAHQNNLTKTNPDDFISVTENPQLVSPYLMDKI